MVPDELPELLVLAHHIRRPALVGVKGGLRHLRIELLEAPSEGGYVRKIVHGSDM